MKKNIIITILILIIICLLIFISADKRLIINPLSTESTEYTTYTTTASSHTAYETTEEPSYSTTEAEPVHTDSSGYTIVIDPGHQQKGNSQQEPVAPGASQTKAKVTSGTSGTVTGTPEYMVNLQVSLKLKSELEKRGYTVIMTRETNNVDISNSQRAQIANNANAAAFIRIHCNGSTDPGVSGALTMCQTPDNIYCGSIYDKSRKLSENVIDSLCSSSGAYNRGVSETDTMSGINWCKVPVTIVEMGFMTNPEEDRLLNDSDYQDKLAQGIANGIDNFIFN